MEKERETLYGTDVIIGSLRRGRGLRMSFEVGGGRKQGAWPLWHWIICPASLGVQVLSEIYAWGGEDGKVELCDHLWVGSGEARTLSAGRGE